MGPLSHWANSINRASGDPSSIRSIGASALTRRGTFSLASRLQPRAMSIIARGAVRPMAESSSDLVRGCTETANTCVERAAYKAIFIGCILPSGSGEAASGPGQDAPARTYLLRTMRDRVLFTVDSALAHSLPRKTHVPPISKMACHCRPEHFAGCMPAVAPPGPRAGGRLLAKSVDLSQTNAQHRWTHHLLRTR